MKVELELLNAKNGVQRQRTDDDVERQPLTGVLGYDSLKDPEGPPEVPPAPLPAHVTTGTGAT
ncbi:hypothetical protein M3Y99_00669400 [Aphelenchoides fujianensis]|nr:hypothetical protein M3Y99_00669400 [Aphelenchoides fujianensis]